MAKAHGADDIVDLVVPRAAIPRYMAAVAEIAKEHGALITGCGHVGDGNVHLSVFQPDPDQRTEVLRAVFRAGMAWAGPSRASTASARRRRSTSSSSRTP